MQSTAAFKRLHLHYVAPLQSPSLFLSLLLILVTAILKPGEASTLRNASPLRATGATRQKLSRTTLQWPLSFERNQGQTNQRVKFLSRGSGYSLFLAPDEAVLSLRYSDVEPQDREAKPELRPSPARRLKQVLNHRTSATAALHMRLLGAQVKSHLQGLDRQPGASNYFCGNDKRQWKTNVEHFGKVRYQQVYPGVDLLYYGNQQQLEYDFLVAPGANPAKIRLQFQGAHSSSINRNGDLVFAVGRGTIINKAPIAYQQIKGRRVRIACRYQWDTKTKPGSPRAIGFELGNYDRRKPLTIDPILSFSTYLGGSSIDQGNGITVDSSGNIYIVGTTQSVNFPTRGPFIATARGNYDVFVAKLNATGTAVIFSTYLGGSGLDIGYSIALDAARNIYVTGNTSSSNFPVRNAYQPTYAGLNDAFVTKLSATGNALVYSTYFGGSDGIDIGTGIAVDRSNNAYVTGETDAFDFPAANTYRGGSADAFVTKFDAAGKAVYSNYLGGDDEEGGNGIAVGADGSAYVTGGTLSFDFTTRNALQPFFAGSNGGGDAFVTKLNPSGTQILYSTFLGGIGADFGSAIAVDAAGNAYVTGLTRSTDFPRRNALQPTYGGGEDVFVTKINATGSALLYSTYFGRAGDEVGFGIAVDRAGNATITGRSRGETIPLRDPIQAINAGSADPFVVQFSAAGTSLVYSTYLGGSFDDTGYGITVDAAGTAYVIGQTASSDFPTRSAYQATYRQSTDAFIAKVMRGPGPPTISTFSPTSGTVGSTVIISGLNLGQSTVFFNGIRATVNAAQSSLTRLTVTVPAGATTGPIRVETPSGTVTSTTPFTVVPLVRYAIRGKVTRGTAPLAGKPNSTDPISNAPVYLVNRSNLSALGAVVANPSLLAVSAAAVTRAITNASGDYAFSALPGSYVVIPALTGVDFNPTYRIVTVTSASLINQNFSGVSLDPAAPGLTITSGVATNSGGSATGTATDNGSGILSIVVTLQNSSGQYLDWTAAAGSTQFTARPILNSYKLAGTAPGAVPLLNSARIVTQNWGIALPASLPAGTYRVSAQAIDRAFRLSPLGTRIVTKTATTPASILDAELSTITTNAATGTVTLCFNNALDADTAGNPASYTIEVNGTPIPIESVSYNQANFSVTLALPTGSLQAGDHVVVRWDGLKDAAGNSFAGRAGPLAAR